MCGGFVLAYSNAKINEKTGKMSQSLCHLYYNIGRITSYCLLGALFGFLAQNLSLSRVAMGYVYFIVGLFLCGIGVSMLGQGRFLRSLESSVLLHKKVKQIFLSLVAFKSKFSFYLLGMFNGLFPCGLVYYFLALSLASASWFKGAFIMMIFGFSTLPAMFSVGFLVGFLKSTRFKTIMMKISSVIIVCQGIYLSFQGFLATQHH